VDCSQDVDVPVLLGEAYFLMLMFQPEGFSPSCSMCQAVEGGSLGAGNLQKSERHWKLEMVTNVPGL
jgi:hypothetical protein